MDHSAVHQISIAFSELGGYTVFTSITAQWKYILILLLQVDLGDGVLVPKKKLDHVLKRPTDSKFCKDMVRILWRPEELLNRSVTGQPCRRLLKEPGMAEAIPKRALTPKKLDGLKRELGTILQLVTFAVAFYYN